MSYSEDIGMSESDIRQWVSSKEELGVFAPIEERSTGPDHRSREIVDRVNEQFPDLKW